MNPSGVNIKPRRAAHLQVVRGVDDADKLARGGEHPLRLVVLKAQVNEI